MQAHIGIASGVVVASGTGSGTYTEYTVTGDSVNLASRLDDLARPGRPGGPASRLGHGTAL
jgi:class 3 adenylate cyclase